MSAQAFLHLNDYSLNLLLKYILPGFSTLKSTIECYATAVMFVIY